jgi:tungstate transport system substrate-binding protein
MGNLGNAQTTLFANRRNAYLLMDRATYLILKNCIKLVPLVEKDTILLNYIAAIQVNPKKFPDVKADEAKAFIDWLCSDEAQTIIKGFGVQEYKEPLFFPNSDEWIAALGSFEKYELTKNYQREYRSVLLSTNMLNNT